MFGGRRVDGVNPCDGAWIIEDGPPWKNGLSDNLRFTYIAFFFF